MLPSIPFKQKRYGGDEIFFITDHELMRVVSQGNPVYLALELPGMETRVVICFPAPTITRVYAHSRGHSCFIGESENPFPVWTAPTEVAYCYGMQFVPWMFLGSLSPLVPRQQDHVVNYIVLNCPVGHEGVNIRLLRKTNHEERREEWLEIYQFGTGNEYHFAEELPKQRRLIARFVPDNLPPYGTTWKPEGGWEKYRSEKIPCKLD